MRFLVTAAFISALGCATAAAALADPADDINQAIRTFASAKSVHVDVTSARGSGTEDMVAPNKSNASYAFMGHQIQIVKIGSDRWINVTGQWKRARSASALAINSQIDAAVNAVLQQKDVREEYVVSDGGTATVGTVPAHKYHLVDKDTSKSGDVFVGADHLPLRIVIDMESGPLTFTYSRYNSVPDISPPI
jgi:outer membrane lipoprotein-sorting protein